MRAAFIRRYGDNSVAETGDLPQPVAGPGEMLVAVRAAGVNPVDFKMRQGKLKALFQPPFPLVLGQEISGIVAALGPGASRHRVGDEVFARLDKARIGGFAEFAVVREADAAPKPGSLTHVEAASLPLVGLTSWQALVEIGRVGPGMTVLIHAGSGGVGSFAIQLARHLGARVATTCGARNLALVRGLGAEIAIDYAAERFEDRVRDVDLVFDTLGGAVTERSFATLKRGGTLVDIVNLPTPEVAAEYGAGIGIRLALRLLSARRRRLAAHFGVRYAYLLMRADGAALAEIGRLADSGAIRPTIDRVFPLERAREALARVESGRATGKVVVEVSRA